MEHRSLPPPRHHPRFVRVMAWTPAARSHPRADRRVGFTNNCNSMDHKNTKTRNDFSREVRRRALRRIRCVAVCSNGGLCGPGENHPFHGKQRGAQFLWCRVLSSPMTGPYIERCSHGEPEALDAETRKRRSAGTALNWRGRQPGNRPRRLPYLSPTCPVGSIRASPTPGQL